MPDHFHVLPEGTSDAANFLELMRIFKQRSAYHWKRRYGRELWQRNYIERVLRDEEDTSTVARYILENPVRAGLVRSPGGYRFSGSLVMDLDAALDSFRRT
jgi:putative transposase